MGKRKSKKSSSRKENSPEKKSISANAVDGSGAVDIRGYFPTILVCLFLLAVTVAVYWQVGNHEFVIFDDDLYVTENPQVQEGLTSESVRWAFSDTAISYWHPLTWLSLMLDYELYELNSQGYHLTNVLFHALATLLLFLALKRMTGSLWKSGFVAALFAVHPLNVESVAWVVERKSVLSAFFWMLTMWLYVRYAERPRLSAYLLVALTFALGLMAKSMLVTLPFVFLLLDYWPLRRLRLWRFEDADTEKTGEPMTSGFQRTPPYLLVLEKIPLLALSAVAIYFTSLSVQSSGMVISTESVPMKLRVANGLVSYVKYLEKMIWPQNLAVFYPYPSKVAFWQVAGAGLLLGAATLMAMRMARRYPYLAVGWLWYLGSLVPVIGLKQAGLWPAMADRFAYLPLIGIFIIIAWGVPELLAVYRYRIVIMTVAAGIVLLALVVGTRTQLHHWRNSTTLFEHAIQATSNNYHAYNNLGNALLQQGHVDQAVIHYTEALQIKPDYALTHHNLGQALERQGRLEEAIRHYHVALRINPKFIKAHNSLGIVLARQGKLEEAIVQYNEALRLKPGYAKAHNNLAIALARQGDFQKALAHFAEALRLKPDYAEAHNNLGVALTRSGRLVDAKKHFSEALRFNPGSAEIHNNLAVVMAKLGNLETAILHYNKALALQPNYAEAHNNLGNALSEQGKLNEAIASFSKALEIRANYPEAHNNLGVVLARNGRLNEAIEHFSEALKFKPDYTQARTNIESALQAVSKTAQSPTIQTKP